MLIIATRTARFEDRFSVYEKDKFIYLNNISTALVLVAVWVRMGLNETEKLAQNEVF